MFLTWSIHNVFTICYPYGLTLFNEVINLILNLNCLMKFYKYLVKTWGSDKMLHSTDQLSFHCPEIISHKTYIFKERLLINYRKPKNICLITWFSILHTSFNMNHISTFYCEFNKYMLSGCELIDTENISLPSQNMKFGDEWVKRTSHKLHILSSRLIFFSINHIHIQMTCLSSLNQT